MGLYSPDEYFKKLYPGAFRERASLRRCFIYFYSLADVSILSIPQVFRKKAKMIIDNNKQEIGDVIDYRLHGNVLSYRLLITKISDTEWMAVSYLGQGGSYH